MRRTLVILLTILVCMFSATGTAKDRLSASARKLQGSVSPIRDDQGNIFCTAFSVNQRRGYWMTARHCTDEYTPKHTWFGTVGIGYSVATVVYRDPVWDVAIIQAFTNVPAVRMGEEPGVGDPVMMAGFPYGLEANQPPVAFGRLGALWVLVPPYMPSTGLDISVAPGNSGSPVADMDGRLVGVLWGGDENGSHALAVPYDVVRRVFEAYAK